jgi:hypothetical protein
MFRPQLPGLEIKLVSDETLFRGHEETVFPTCRSKTDRDKGGATADPHIAHSFTKTANEWATHRRLPDGLRQEPLLGYRWCFAWSQKLRAGCHESGIYKQQLGILGCSLGLGSPLAA